MNEKNNTKTEFSEWRGSLDKSGAKTYNGDVGYIILWTTKTFQSCK